MRKSFNLIWMVFGFLLLIVGCNEDKKSTAFDPNQPVKFTEFMPIPVAYEPNSLLKAPISEKTKAK